VLNNVRNKFP